MKEKKIVFAKTYLKKPEYKNIFIGKECFTVEYETVQRKTAEPCALCGQPGIGPAHIALNQQKYVAKVYRVIEGEKENIILKHPINSCPAPAKQILEKLKQEVSEEVTCSECKRKQRTGYEQQEEYPKEFIELLEETETGVQHLKDWILEHLD